MKPDIKIGVLMGVVVAAVLLVFFVKKGSGPDENTPLVPQDKIQGPIQPVDEPVVKELGPVDKPVIIDPEPKSTIPAVKPEPKIDPEPPEKSIASTPIEPTKPTPEVREPRYHQVVSGESLSEISEKYYGHEKFRGEIYKANRDLINNPDLLQVGWRLRIPYAKEIAGLGQNE